MKIKFIEKQSFAVIGKLGQGFASENYKWIPPLWQEANTNYNEISSLAKLDDSGNMVGLWGAMSDINEKFERWNAQGKYLAGCEVRDDAVPPDNWTKWTVPSYKYVTAKCTQSTYQETFNYMLKEYLPKHKLSIVGAVHEFYDPKDSDGELYLYFPIERL